MIDKFQDIVDVQFTSNMESRLDLVESGEVNYQEILEQFYASFAAELAQAEIDLEKKRIKVPDEESEEVCELCGKKMVIKNGRFGKFLACPGYPECGFTMPLVVEMPGKCPGCGSRILKRTSRNGHTYYACEKGKECPWRGVSAEGGELIGFMTWDVPVKDNCPVCGRTMFKKSGRGAKKPFCIHEDCSNFTPEDKRGGWKKPAADAKGERKTAKKTAAKKPAAKKTTAKKTTKKAKG